jgi:hypothetical protein
MLRDPAKLALTPGGLDDRNPYPITSPLSVSNKKAAFPSPAGDLAFGYPAKDQRRGRRLKSMLALNKRRVPEAVPALCCVPVAVGRATGLWRQSLSGAKALVSGVSTPFSEGGNAGKSAGLSKADQRACRHR